MYKNLSAKSTVYEQTAPLPTRLKLLSYISISLLKATNVCNFSLPRLLLPQNSMAVYQLGNGFCKIPEGVVVGLPNLAWAPK